MYSLHTFISDSPSLSMYVVTLRYMVRVLSRVFKKIFTHCTQHYVTSQVYCTCINARSYIIRTSWLTLSHSFFFWLCCVNYLYRKGYISRCDSITGTFPYKYKHYNNKKQNEVCKAYFMLFVHTLTMRYYPEISIIFDADAPTTNWCVYILLLYYYHHATLQRVFKYMYVT